MGARAEARVRARESRRQKNLEGTLRQAARALPEHVSETPVDPDWIAEFFNNCQDIGDEQMQILWGRLLAGEVAAPGSFSRQTLDIVRLLSKADADLFSRVCSAVWSTPDQKQPIIDFPHEMAKTLGLGNNISRLAELGLVSIALTSMTMQWIHDEPIVLEYFGLAHRLITPRPNRRPGATSHLPVTKPAYPCGRVLLTHAGRELMPIAGGESNETYRQSVMEMFRNRGLIVEDGPEAQATPDRQG
jgi:hypothetical protein